MLNILDATRWITGYGLLTAGIAGCVVGFWPGVLMLLSGSGILAIHHSLGRGELRCEFRGRRLPTV